MKNKKSRILTFIITLFLSFTLVACGGKKASSVEVIGGAEKDTESYISDTETNDSSFELSGGEWKPEDAIEQAEEVKEEVAEIQPETIVSLQTATTNDDAGQNPDQSIASDATDTNGSQNTPQSTPENTTTVTLKPAQTVNSKLICIDPGHQLRGDSTKEPNGPGSSVMKARVTGGTTGRTTGVPEYQLNLTIALKLRDELVARGYQVVMTRESHDVNISNKERAELATNAGAAVTVRIHANGSDNASVSGALTMAPSKSNPYVANLASDSQRLSKNIIDAYCAETGLKNQGVVATDTMTGINWCTMPVTIIEMGYMTNQSDDTNMQNADFQTKMVTGIANGIDKYFN